MLHTSKMLLKYRFVRDLSICLAVDCSASDVYSYYLGLRHKFNEEIVLRSC